MLSASHSRQSPVTVKVSWTAEVSHAAGLGRETAASIGFPPAHCEEIRLVVTELATNLVRHASCGTLRFTCLEADEVPGIQIESEDDGPGIADVEQAITDGYSTSSGLGLGLGVVNRLMDDLEISSGPCGGLRVVCQRWLRPQATGDHRREVVFGVATRSFRCQPENGDAFIVKHWDQNALAGVIDGLGHGPAARRASITARQYIEQHYDQPLESIFRGTDRACRATRGVVMGMARFDLVREKVILAGVGNVEMRLIGGADHVPQRIGMPAQRGVVGLNAPVVVRSEHTWTNTNLLVMHSDGLPANWDWSEYRQMADLAPDVLARRLLNQLGSTEDDATVLVARSATR